MNNDTPTPARRRTPPTAAHSDEGRVTAQATRKVGKETIHASDNSKAFPVDGLPEHPARVRISAGITESMGAGTYEFLRIDASVELPCANTKEAILIAKKRASDLVVSFIEEERDKALGTEGITHRA